ncbi:glycosyltransferase family 4 protein [Methanobacterium paludis]|uniref:Glycosyl transferase group 1 n=1 Tax=Methanobacterium paludis (strain DSM 25820 / JCM 18151 / SWAN1) TaxID=868131 RepID=F6D2L6_METPW|nr:glycosyltransferase family 4 protein [Methanobacterium paludis]AEG17950.1 glycosyl transferase group 1 [Methanobacterium paludis]
MKIAFIYDSVYPWVKGGAENRVYQLAKRLVLRGHEVHWYGMGCWWTAENHEDIEFEGIHLHGVCKPIELYSNGKRSIKEAIYFALKLFSPLMKERFDVVECQGFPFFPCFTAKIHAILGRSTLFITLHEVWGDYWYEYLGKLGIFGKIVEKLTLYLTDRIITVSEKTNRDLQAIRLLDGNVIPNGINLKEINFIKKSDKKSDVIFVGRLIKEKNVDLLVKAIDLVRKELPEIKCLIVGDGPERENLEKMVLDRNLSTNIEFTGFLGNHDDLISYMKSSKVFVLPSTREGFGIVVLEANACELPVVVVKHKMNAACDLINNGKNGFVVEPSDKDMAAKIIRGIKDKEKMKPHCVDFASQYDWDDIVGLLEKHYEKSLNRL